MTARPGFITLITILIIAAVATATATTLLLLGVASTRSSFAEQQSVQARALAYACAEEALQQVRDNPAFSGGATLPLGSGTCTYNVQVLAGENRTVTVSGTVGTVVRKAQISVTAINPTITVSTWQEVP